MVEDGLEDLWRDSYRDLNRSIKAWLMKDDDDNDDNVDGSYDDDDKNDRNV
jgi:hypothetical protein